ncbi:MAG: type II toxin-antitoxin system Phd/YefM family antitoxin [Oscillospiraceae bacterium]|jgi:prevent-host-death family protein|nr:type II toxin-antitoxin system Phd/YefM family antitoxin [Oscillospiraceae bacterium]
MTVSIGTLKSNPAKFFELAASTEVIVTRRGKPLGRIISEKPITESAEQKRKREAFERLKEFAKMASPLPDEYKDPNYDPYYDLLKEEYFREKGWITD